MASAPTVERCPTCGMVASESVEDYLKSIYRHSFDGQVTTGWLAEQLGVTPASVSAMVRRLRTAELVRSRADGLALTPHGEQHARNVVRRHRLLETFLAWSLRMGWDEVHAEAEVLEHAVSDRLVDRIDEVLGHPATDPHGDPIPPKSGSYDEAWGPSLADAHAGETFRVGRVRDTDSEALRYLAELGVRPGTSVRVHEQAPFGGPLWIELDGRRHALGRELVGLVHGRVEPDRPDNSPAEPDAATDATGDGDRQP